MFSSNALRVQGDRILETRAAKLEDLRHTGRIALVHPPTNPDTLLQANGGAIDGAAPAPTLLDTWPELCARVTAPLGTLSRDGILVIGETHLEREWSAAGRLAGFLSAEQFFAP